MDKLITKFKNATPVNGLIAVCEIGVGIMAGTKDGVYFTADGEHWEKVEVQNERFIL